MYKYCSDLIGLIMTWQAMTFQWLNVPVGMTKDNATGGIIWEVEGRRSGSKGVAYHTDSPTQVEVFDLGW